MSTTSTPRLKAPNGACDTHMHFYNSAYKPSAKAWLFPPDFLLPAYRKVQQRLGLQRMVLVQPATYGFDNSCILDAADEIGDDARAVVTVPISISDAELDALWKRGARGVRFHQMRGGVMEWRELPIMADRLAGSGWHVQVQLDGMELPQYEKLIADLRGTVVIDHMGRFSQPVSPDHDVFRSLLRLAAQENVYVKMSGAYHISKVGGPGYPDVVPLAAALARQSTERLLWASDWPHPTHLNEHAPDDADLLDFLLACTDTDADRRAILVDNPARLYGY